MFGSPPSNCIIDRISEIKFELTIEEAKQLQKFFFDSGYISHEFHEPIHVLSARLDKFLKDNKNETTT